MLADALRRWPLLIVGAILIGWAVKLADDHDPSDARALLFGVGCTVLGAGLALVLRPDREEPPDDKPDR